MSMARTLFIAALIGVAVDAAHADDAWVTYEPATGPGNGKHIVLVAGDEEYRSEEVIPALAKILSQRHGFKCTVLFAIDRGDGTINPNQRDNIPGLEKLAEADLAVLFIRWRDLPDDQMKPLVDYIESGRPIVGFRTSTHAFDVKSPTYARYTWNDKQTEGGFGRRVLGETWISHHGKHGQQSTRGVIAPGMESHAILRGIEPGSIWGPTDVYGVRLPLAGDSTPLVLGEVLDGMTQGSPPATGEQNDPMMPIAWTKTYNTASGKAARVFTSTMMGGEDFQSEGLRRLAVNACYWALALDDQIPALSNVDFVGEYHALPFHRDGFRKNVKPIDHAIAGGQ